MKTGITGGVFDFLHVGHVRFLKRAKGLCDRLVVVVASDSGSQPKKPLHTQSERVELVASLEFVDEVIAGRDPPDWKEIFEESGADFVILGPDQTLPLRVPAVRICEELAPRRSSEARREWIRGISPGQPDPGKRLP